MIGTMDCAEARISLGVYVLGAIDPAERAAVNAHLATCRDCRDELAGLAALPALLSRVSKEEAIALAEGAPAADQPAAEGPAEPDAAEPAKTTAKPPRELLGTVLDLTAARRRRRQWRAGALSAAAAVIIAVAAFGGARLAVGHGGGTGQPPQSGQSLDYGNPVGAWTTTQGSADGMYATVMYRQMRWGTQLAAKVVGIPVDTACQLVAVGTDGTRVVAGGWTTGTAEGTVWYPASAPVSPKQVKEFQLTVTGHPTITIPS
jgi:hypothetical protein